MTTQRAPSNPWSFALTPPDDVGPEPVPGRCPCTMQKMMKGTREVTIPCENTTTGGICGRCQIECTEMESTG